MPSEVVAQILEIKDIRPHSDPEVERLELATLGGWQIVCGKGLYENGERVVYITPDSLITERLADILEIRQHLNSVRNPDGTAVTNEYGDTMLRVRQAKLRGEPSFGTTIPNDVMIEEYGLDILNEELETNIADRIGILKYEPAMRSTATDAEEDHPLFTKYTSIENIRNYPNVLQEKELVVLTEKIHGTNCRVGMIEGTFMAGSHGLRRKRPESLEDMKRNTYWYPLTLEPVQELLQQLYTKGHKQVILFGEVFGNIQKKYNYGIKNGIGFRAFDLLVDGKYLDHQDFVDTCKEYGVETVPLFLTMGYDYNNITKAVEDVSRTSTLSFDHPMEGVVIKPVKERYDHKVGRVVLKYITNAYLFDKGGSDFKDF